VRGFLPGLLVAVALSACASNGIENVGESDSVALAAAESEAPKKICYRERNTGFRLAAVRVCKTVSE